MGKLGDVSQNATAVIVDLAALEVGGDTLNGPGDLLDWDTIKWRDQEAQERLRRRIFKATQAQTSGTRVKIAVEVGGVLRLF